MSNTCRIPEQINVRAFDNRPLDQQPIDERMYETKIIENYIFCTKDLVGRGASGQVYKGTDRRNGDTVAIKVIDLNQIKDEYTWGLICSEIDIMKKLNCHNVVRLIDVFQTTNNAYIVTELCEDGDLVDYMKKFKGQIKLQTAFSIITNILMGLQELGQHDIIHRDLKPANILITNNRKLFKISDFGFARMVEKKDYLMTSLVGTPLYMSPQILKRQVYSSKCDVWSIGLIFYELVYGQTPWPSNSVIELVQNMFSIPLRFPSINLAGEVVPESAKQFIRSCLKFEEPERYSWEEIYSHQLFRDTLFKKTKEQPSKAFLQAVVPQPQQSKKKTANSVGNIQPSFTVKLKNNLGSINSFITGGGGGSGIYSQKSETSIPSSKQLAPSILKSKGTGSFISPSYSNDNSSNFGRKNPSKVESNEIQLLPVLSHAEQNNRHVNQQKIPISGLQSEEGRQSQVAGTIGVMVEPAEANIIQQYQDSQQQINSYQAGRIHSSQKGVSNTANQTQYSSGSTSAILDSGQIVPSQNHSPLVTQNYYESYSSTPRSQSNTKHSFGSGKNQTNNGSSSFACTGSGAQGNNMSGSIGSISLNSMSSSCNGTLSSYNNKERIVEQNDSQNLAGCSKQQKIEAIREQYKMKVKDKKSIELSSLASCEFDESGERIFANGTDKSVQNGFLHKRQSSARDGMHYISSTNNQKPSLAIGSNTICAIPVQNSAQKQGTAFLNENQCVSPVKNIMNNYDNFMSPLTTEPSSLPVPTVQISLNSQLATMFMASSPQLPISELRVSKDHIYSLPKNQPHEDREQTNQESYIFQSPSSIFQATKSALYPTSDQPTSVTSYHSRTAKKENSVLNYLVSGGGRSITPQGSSKKITGQNINKQASENINTKKCAFNKFATAVYNSEEPSQKNQMASGPKKQPTLSKNSKFNNRLSKIQQSSSQSSSPHPSAKQIFPNRSPDPRTGKLSSTFDPFKTADPALSQAQDATRKAAPPLHLMQSPLRSLEETHASSGGGSFSVVQLQAQRNLVHGNHLNNGEMQKSQQQIASKQVVVGTPQRGSFVSSSEQSYKSSPYSYLQKSFVEEAGASKGVSNDHGGSFGVQQQPLLPQHHQNQSFGSSIGLSSYQLQTSGGLSPFMQQQVIQTATVSTNSSIDRLQCCLHFPRFLLSIVKILSNANFISSYKSTASSMGEIAYSEHSQNLPSKVCFILLKDAMMKLAILNERMFSQGENVLELADWQAFRLTGKFFEVQTQFFLLTNEVSTAFTAEKNKCFLFANSDTDYSFTQLLHDDSTSSFQQRVNAKFDSRDKADVVNRIVWEDIFEYYEILKLNRIEGFHGQVFARHATFLGKFATAYNFLTLSEAKHDANQQTRIIEKAQQLLL